MKIILEGLTGTGKSSTLAAMHRAALTPALVVPEDDTFGDLMDELARGPLDTSRLTHRLDAITTRLERERPPEVLLERFHLSYYAQVPDWARYRELDLRLADLGVSLALLVVPDAVLKARSLCRAEYGDTDWQGFVAHYGSEHNAIEALRRSQDRRLEALTRTQLPHLTVDTSGLDWDTYALTIARWSADREAPPSTPTHV